MKYTSKIFVTVDIIIANSSLDKILLIQRLNDPFKGMWALPGGFVDENEDLETAAHRELKEETSLQVEKLIQVKAFGKPGRDPRQHTVSVAFCGIACANAQISAADDAKDARWFLRDNLPELAFDHSIIIKEADKVLKTF